jgi:hypothetical protein
VVGVVLPWWPSVVVVTIVVEPSDSVLVVVGSVVVVVASVVVVVASVVVVVDSVVVVVGIVVVVVQPHWCLVVVVTGWVVVVVGSVVVVLDVVDVHPQPHVPCSGTEVVPCHVAPFGHETSTVSTSVPCTGPGTTLVALVVPLFGTGLV